MSRGASQKEYFGIFWHRISGRIGNRERLYAECLWSGMILSGILWAAVHGRLDQVDSGSAGLGKRGGILMHYNAGSYVAVDGNTGNRPRSGTDRTSSRTMRPVLRFLFPHLLRTVRRPDRFSINLLPIY